MGCSGPSREVVPAAAMKAQPRRHCSVRYQNIFNPAVQRQMKEWLEKGPAAADSGATFNVGPDGDVYITIDQSRLDELQRDSEQKMRDQKKPKPKWLIALQSFFAGLGGGAVMMGCFHVGHLLAVGSAAVCGTAVVLNPLCWAACAAAAVVIAGITVGVIIFEEKRKKAELDEMLELNRRLFQETRNLINQVEIKQNRLEEQVRELQRSCAQLQQQNKSQEAESARKLDELIKTYETKLRREQDRLMTQAIQDLILSEDKDSRDLLQALLTKQALERSRCNDSSAASALQERHRKELDSLRQVLQQRLHDSVQQQKESLRRQLETRFQQDMEQLKQQQTELTQQLLNEKEASLKQDYEQSKKDAKVSQLQILLGQYQRALDKARFDTRQQAEEFEDRLNQAVQAALKEQSDSMLERMLELEQNALRRQEQAVLEGMCWAERNALQREGNRLRDMERLLDCPVCMSRNHDTVLECGHSLCQQCVSTLQQAGDPCPTCRKKLAVLTTRFV